jgi:hypothetical protein
MSRATVGITLTLAVLFGIGAFAVSNAAPRKSLRTITVMERSEQAKIRPNGPPGFGASLAFNARLTSESGKPVGQLIGYGGFATQTRVVANAVYFLPNGQLDVILSATPGYKKATAAVVGGTGAFAGAGGTVTSVANHDGSFTDTIDLSSG